MVKHIYIKEKKNKTDNITLDSWNQQIQRDHVFAVETCLQIITKQKYSVLRN